jgi:hypothetical protein
MRSVLFFSLLFLVLSACGDRKTKESFREFADFYEKFHKDTTFQAEHCQFPMEGMPDNAGAYEGNLSEFRWTKDKWTIHKPIDFGKSGYKQELQPIGPDLIIETIIDPSGEYGLSRRFARINGKWTLIYYAGMNRIERRG